MKTFIDGILDQIKERNLFKEKENVVLVKEIDSVPHIGGLLSDEKIFCPIKLSSFKYVNVRLLHLHTIGKYVQVEMYYIFDNKGNKIIKSNLFEINKENFDDNIIDFKFLKEEISSLSVIRLKSEKFNIRCAPFVYYYNHANNLVNLDDIIDQAMLDSMINMAHTIILTCINHGGLLSESIIGDIKQYLTKDELEFIDIYNDLLKRRKNK